MPIELNHVKGVPMKKQRILLAVLMFSASAWVSAGVPTIKLLEPHRSELSFTSLLALNGTFFESDNRRTSAGTGTGNRIDALQSAPVPHAESGVFSGILEQVENNSALARRQVSAGSFSSNARQAYSSSYASYIAPASSGTAAMLYGSIVASSPAPKSWAVILLLLGCVMYQGRRRQRPFGF